MNNKILLTFFSKPILLTNHILLGNLGPNSFHERSVYINKRHIQIQTLVQHIWAAPWLNPPSGSWSPFLYCSSSIPCSTLCPCWARCFRDKPFCFLCVMEVLSNRAMVERKFPMRRVWFGVYNEIHGNDTQLSVSVLPSNCVRTSWTSYVWIRICLSHVKTCISIHIIYISEPIRIQSMTQTYHQIIHWNGTVANAFRYKWTPLTQS